MNNILYIAEGETEERFIKFLTQNDFIRAGKFKKFNLMQDKLTDRNSILASKVSGVYCILDTDLISPDNVSNLFFNLKKLKGICRNGIFSLIQNKNFEDELKFVFCCKDLGKLFNLTHNTTKDLKLFLTQKVNYKNYITEEKLQRYCSRPQDFQEALKNLNQSADKIRIVNIEKCIL